MNIHSHHSPKISVNTTHYYHNPKTTQKYHSFQFITLLNFNHFPSMILCLKIQPPPYATAFTLRSSRWFGSNRLFVVVEAKRKMDCVKRIGNCFKDVNGTISSTTSSTIRKGINVEVHNGGEDLLDASVTVSPHHLVVMVNGIIGSSADWRYAAEQFVKKLPDKVIVHRSECNTSKLTFDGVDLMGERLAEEVLAVVKRRPEVRKISFVAHSLGGLIARYAIARLYGHEDSRVSGNSLSEELTNSKQSMEQSCEATVAGLEPINFVTFASPHLGSRGHKQLPFLCGLPFLEQRASQTAHLIVGRTGKHLFLTDNDDGKPPLLLQMVNDSDDLKFISALRLFKRRVAYANANFDHMVGWRTSSIRRQHELPKANLLMVDQKYPHIVFVEQVNMDNQHDEEYTLVEAQTTDLEEEMIKGLNQVPWERVDVSFNKSRQRYIAHSTIQVKTYWLNSDGADVVSHMIDNFLL